MNNIYTIDNIDFNNLSLSNPTSMKGSAHISKIKYNNNDFYIQFPKCKSKNSIIITGKSKYIDIMYNNEDINIIDWFENLEETLQNIIYTKSVEWFDNAIEKNDIENAFISSIRLYKSGTQYLIRVQIPNSIINNLCYNENNELINYTLVNNTSEFIPLLEFSGIKFTSTTFQPIINIKQLLLIEPIKFDTCIINYNKNLSHNVDPNTNIEADNVDPDTNIVTHNVDPNTNNETDHVEPYANNESSNVDSYTNNESDHVEVTTNTKPDNNTADIEPDTTNNSDNVEDMNNKLQKLNTKDNETIGIINDSLEDLEEVDILADKNMPFVNIKKSNEIYHDLWEKTYNKAKELKLDAIKTFLEAKKIKNTYLLDEFDDDIHNENLEELNIIN